MGHTFLEYGGRMANAGAGDKFLGITRKILISRVIQQ